MQLRQYFPFVRNLAPLTFNNFELVSMHSFKHVSKKSTWSLNSWSTVCTFSSLRSSSRQFGSSTSNVANARICCTNASIRARSRNTRLRHAWKSSCQSLVSGAGVEAEGSRDEEEGGEVDAAAPEEGVEADAAEPGDAEGEHPGRGARGGELGEGDEDDEDEDELDELLFLCPIDAECK